MVSNDALMEIGCCIELCIGKDFVGLLVVDNEIIPSLKIIFDVEFMILWTMKLDIVYNLLLCF